MSKELIGEVSGILVFLSIFPYAYRVWKKDIIPNPITWFIWSVGGVALLLTYKGVGADKNVWPAIAGAFNPVLVFFIAMFHGKRAKITLADTFCLVLGITAIGLWFWIEISKNKVYAPYALYIGIVGDACAAVPTFRYIRKEPQDDRPLMWILFAIGYCLAIFAVDKQGFSNYVLPIYMFIMATIISMPLVAYRIQNKIPIGEWV